MKKTSIFTIIFLIALVSGGYAKTIKTHAISLVDGPKHGKDFKHFEYVNPDAPKGGTLKMGAFGQFDSFNPFALKGRAAMGTGYLYESLMTATFNEASTYYGLIAESLEYEDDYSSATFNIRKEARFHDGKPITSEDVVFSFKEMTRVHPYYKNYFKLIKKVVPLGPQRVKFIFKEGTNKEMPLIAGQLSIIPKHYWKTRDLSKSTFDVPLGSGPYKIVSYESGKRVVLERVKDYWAKDLPVNKGQYNFDKIIYEYFKDHTVSFEAFKAGAYDIRGDGPGKRWEEEYKGKNFDNEFIKKLKIHHKKPAGMAGYVMNTKKPFLKDINIRKALILAYDFNWLNKSYYYGKQKRHNSFFSNTSLACSGLPKGKELEILKSIKDLIPPEVFTKVPSLPETDGKSLNREDLQKAVILLKKAGYKFKNGFMTDKSGKKVSIEVLIASKSFEKDLLPFKERLARIGIELIIKFVDSTHYIEKIRSHDFMMIYTRYSQSLSPGNEQTNMWHSQAAGVRGSKNYSGLAHKGVDKLVELVIDAPDRETLVAASKALDRVLLNLSIIVPDGYTDMYRIAHWNKFGRPAKPPQYSLSFSSWWIDVEKEKRINAKLNPFTKTKD